MNYIDYYAEYICSIFPNTSFDILDIIESISLQTNWQNPKSGLDWNNWGVVTIVRAINASSLEERSHLCSLAINYFQRGLSYPLSLLHYFLFAKLIGERSNALLNSYSYLIKILQPWLGHNQVINRGLIFLPSRLNNAIHLLLSTANGYEQTAGLAGIIFASTYSYQSLETRWLKLSISLLPEYTPALLKLGLWQFYNQEYEGIYYLHQAQKHEPSNPAVVQSLYLAYQNLQSPQIASYWKSMGRDYYLATDPHNPCWFWSTLPDAFSFTYVLFQGNILLAVVPDLSQVVTIVLLADGDWFEAEMEFWVNNLQPGMTVIDVGANVGVYTFSAARAVGETGCVVAIEPFPPCVNCLEETKRINNFGQVVIKQAAATDCVGTVYLGTSRSSEFNAITADRGVAGIEVPAITLDALVRELDLSAVDVLKIDAEGHEMAVLRGATEILTKYSPLIMYENISSHNSNTEVATYLQEQGYKLYRYRPFLMQLLPIDNLDHLEGTLNVIARRE